MQASLSRPLVDEGPQSRSDDPSYNKPRAPAYSCQEVTHCAPPSVLRNAGALFGPFFVKRAAGFSLCVALFVLHKNDREVSLVGVAGMAFNIALAVIVLYGLTVMFIRLREEYRRNLPHQE